MKKNIHMYKRIQCLIIACIILLFSLVSTTALAKRGQVYRSESLVLIENNVEKVSGNYFYKDNILYQFTKSGKKKVVLKQIIKNFYSINGSLVALDKQGRLWAKGKFRKYFYYKKEQKDVIKLRVVEKNVSKLWVNSYGIAFVRKGKLYVYGQPEFIRDYINYATTDFGPLLYDTETPPYLVEYTGIKVSTISNVFFTQTHVVVTTKAGEVYSVLPEQIKDGKYFYYKERTISQNDLLNMKDIKDYAHNFVIKKNGNALVWLSNEKHDGYWDSFKNGKEVHLKKVNKIINTGKNTYILKKSGKVYGFGKNTAKILKDSKQKEHSFVNKVLIANGIKDISVVGRGLFCLKKNGDLYFRGSNSGNISLKYNLNP